MGLLDDISDAATSVLRIRCAGDGGRFVSGDAVWMSAHNVASRIHRDVPAGTSVAGFFTNALPVIACAFGTWLAGRRLVSLPLPARGQPARSYADSLRSILGSLEVGMLFAEESVLPLVGPIVADLAVSVDAADALATDRVSAAGYLSDGADFVQFTSGSTSDPRGIVLPLESIHTNVLGLLGCADGFGDASTVSWLPLSHDMGFIGMLVTSWIGGGPAWADGGGLRIDRPTDFLSDPASWLQALHDERATNAAVPPFALDIAAKLMEANPRYDLRAMRSLIVGGDVLLRSTVDRFMERAQACGMAEAALSPAYGLAEAVLGVTMLPFAQPWESCEITLDDADPSDSISLVSSGTPLDGVTISIDQAPGSSFGEILVRTRASAAGFLSVRDGSVSKGDSVLRTGDLGTVRDGHLYVLGRNGDFVKIGGRKVFFGDIEEAVAAAGLASPSRVTAIPGAAGGYEVVLERVNAVADDGVHARVSRAASDAVGTAPRAVHIVPRGALPRTTSGKRRRQATAELVRDVVQ